MSKKKNQDIAIIGMSCWYPGSKGLIEFWENILAKRKQFRRMLDCRLPLADYHSPNKSTPDMTYGTRAAFIEGFEFDWATNRFPKSAFDSTDLSHWLALDVAIKAAQDAGLSRQNIPLSKTGVIVGNSLTGETSRSENLRTRWPYFKKVLKESGIKAGLSDTKLSEFVNSTEQIFKSLFPAITEDSLAGSLANTIAGRICNYFNLDGGGFTIDGACSSSLLAVANAATSLVTGDLDLALVGGVDISLDNVELIGFAKVGALTETDIKVYDRDGKGFIPGEGSGFVVLKRLEDAKRDGNKIYALLKGWGISSDGNGGLTAPKASGQAKALVRAYQRAGYKVTDCNFIEGHGTGTAVGDKRELEGIDLAAKELGVTSTNRTIGMTSLKSIIGHTKAAAGIGAFIKATIALNRRILPPTSGCENPNPVFKSTAHGLFPLTEGEIKSPKEILRAGVSAMGFGGINCHVTLESYGTPLPSLAPSIAELALLTSYADSELFLFTSQSIGSLKNQVTHLLEEAPHMSAAELTDVAAELCRRAIPNAPYRAALMADSISDFISKLHELEVMLTAVPKEGEYSSNPTNTIWLANKTQKPKVGFIFPGQGSQKINMGRELVDRFPWAKSLVDNLFSNLNLESKTSFIEHIFKPLHRAIDKDEQNPWIENLTKTEIAQPAICLTSVLWLQRLNELGITCTAVAGHSLGELSALYAAGAIDEKTLLEIAITRGKLMSASPDQAGTMASLSCDFNKAAQILQEVGPGAVIANINGPQQIVISGEVAAIEKATQIAMNYQVNCTRLNVSNAFHSPLVSKAADKLKKSLEPLSAPLKFNKSVFSGIPNKKLIPKDNIAQYLSEQIVSPVNFISIYENISQACDLLIEVGPGAVLSGLIKNITNNQSSKCFPVESKPGKSSDLLRVIAIYFIAGGEIHFEKIFSNRLVRPYTKFKEKLFIVNPCERPFPEELLGTKNINQEMHTPIGVPTKIANMTPPSPLPEPVSNVIPIASRPAPKAQTSHKVSANEIQQTLFKTLESTTGLSADVFKMEMRLLDDLNLDSIKAGEVISSLATTYSLNGALDPIQFANATLGEIIDLVMKMAPQREEIAFAQAASFGSMVHQANVTPKAPHPLKVAQQISVSTSITKDDVRNNLIAILQTITGLSSEVFKMEMRLLDDLNLDSIKAGEVISSLATTYSLNGALDPIQFANATLGEIIELVSKMGPSKEQIGPTQSVSKPEITNTIVVPIKAVSSIQNTSTVTKEDIRGNLIKILQVVTGLTADVFKMEMRLLDDLNLDSIKAGEAISNLATTYSLNGSLDPIQFANATLGEIIEIVASLKTKPTLTPAPIESARPSDPIFEILLEATAEVSGYPKTSLDAKMQFQSDLRIDKTQLGNIVQMACKQIGIEPTLDLPAIENYSIEKLITILKDIKQNQKNYVSKQTKITEISTNTPWVRNFVLNIAPKERPKLTDDKSNRYIDQWANAKILILADFEENTFTKALADTFIQAGSSVSVLKFSDFDTAKSASVSEYSHVLYVLPNSSTTGIDQRSALVERTKRLTFFTTLPKLENHPLRYRTLVCIQFGDGYFNQKDSIQDFHLCSMSSLLQTVHIERPDLRVRYLEISSALEVKKASNEILNEINTPEQFTMVGYAANGERLVPEMNLSQPSQYTNRNIKWSSKDVMLVTGGAKGITAECAFAFAKEHNIKLALVGSSPNNVQNSELTKNLEKFKTARIQCVYYQCDMTDQKAVQRTISEVTRELGPISAVLHGAGKNIPRRSTTVTASQALDEISPKLLGAINLLENLSPGDLKLFSAFTSIIGLMGVPGNAWYGFSNEALNNLLLKFGKMNPNVQVVTCAFGMWAEVGMAHKLGSVKKFSNSGLALIPLEEGVKRFMELTNKNPGHQQVVVAARIWKDSPLARKTLKVSKYRFLENIVNNTHKVETISRVHLKLETDLYLLDHKYNGTYIFPTVFGLEAMAQVAAYTLGIEKIESLTINDLDLSSAITVKPDTGTEIEIYAVVDEVQSIESEISIKVGVRSATSNFTKDCFSAIFKFNSPFQQKVVMPECLNTNLNLNPKENIYGPLLFHGPTYQRIHEFHQLDSKETTFSAIEKNQHFNQTASFSDPNLTLMLGDPYLRDSLLQAAQPVLTKNIFLPVFCKNWKISNLKSTDAIRIVHFLLHNFDGRKFTSEVKCFSKEGVVLEVINGSQGIAVKAKAENPTPEEMTTNHKYNLNFQLHELTKQKNLLAPQIWCDLIPEISKIPQDQRHQLEIQFLKAMAEKNNRYSQIDFSKVTWKPSGKPTLKDSNNPIHFSLSHSGNFCAAALFNQEVGCDLEEIGVRNPNEWTSLLGPEFSKVFKTLTEGSQDINLVGSYIWAAREAAAKALDLKEFAFSEFSLIKGGAYFQVSREKQVTHIFAYEVSLHKTQRYVFAVAYEQVTKNASYESIFNVYPDFQGEKGFRVRWPITFKDASSAGKNLYFTKFFEWQGRAREIAIWPLLEEATNVFTKGEFGWVTNSSETQILKSAEVGDLIEVRMSAGSLHGQSNSSLEAFYDWYRIERNGQETLIAKSKMLTTWVKIIGHGLVEVAPFPKAFEDFFISINRPSAQIKLTSDNSTETQIYQAPSGIATGPILASHTFETALEDSNLVGNVYFSNYSVWQGRTRDSFLNKIYPELVKNAADGEPFTKYCYIKHLREAMPFDQVRLIMYLKSFSKNSIKLYFDYHQFADGKLGHKIAFAEHELTWASRSRDTISQVSIPEKVIYFLKMLIREQEAEQEQKKKTA